MNRLFQTQKKLTETAQRKLSVILVVLQLSSAEHARTLL